ncbi:MAG: radical SAM protein [Ruminococcus sp.]|nr:radical SAM protein [Ruminococcus sp.]
MTPDSSAYIRRHLSQKCAHLRIPVSGIFELTPRCNLGCKMCYVRLTPQQMAPIGREKTCEEWISLAKEAKDAGMVFLLITGGEPTLREDFPEIYRSLAQMGLSISINTNGTLITPAVKSLFEEFPPAQINLTLYGVCDEDYQELCGDKNAYSKVLDALDWFCEHDILVHLNATMTPDNYPKWQAYEDFAKERDLELRMTSYCFPPTRRSECDKCSDFSRLTPEEAGSLIAEEILYREGLNSIKLRAKDLSSPLQHSCDLDTGEPMQCLAGRSQFWLTWDGRLTPCGMLGAPDTRPFEEGFLNAWKSLCKEVDEIRLCSECATCEIQASCMNCAAVTFAETGSFNGKPEYMCSLNKAYREAVTKLANQ